MKENAGFNGFQLIDIKAGLPPGAYLGEDENPKQKTTLQMTESAESAEFDKRRPPQMLLPFGKPIPELL